MIRYYVELKNAKSICIIIHQGSFFANFLIEGLFSKTLGKPDYKITVKTTYGLKKGLLGA